MAEALGMTPENVESYGRQISGYTDSLEAIAGDVSQAGWASRNPTLFDLIPGASLVMTAGSVLLAESAAADVRAAVGSAYELLSRLTQQVADQRFASSADDGSYILGFVSAASAQQMYEDMLKDPGALDELTPAQVAAFWKYLSQEQSDELWQTYPLLIGNKSGVPLTVRMEANRLTAIDRLQSGDALSADEQNYLALVESGDIQLVTYDPENSRIVEAINLATWDESQDPPRFVQRETAPTDVITYVPGTLSDLPTFYSGENYQNFVLGLIGDSDSVAFVYKDGWFPGEHNPSDQAQAIIEASDQQYALDAGVTLAAFHDDVMRESVLSGSEQTIIGHSWGLANVTASEIAGAKYDNVISLAGAYMPDGWVPDPDTDYAHHSYVDWLELAHRADNAAPDWIVDQVVPDSVLPGDNLVGSGDFPGDNPAFDRYVYGAPDPYDVMGNHELIHDSNSPNNVDAMDNIRQEIYG
ncbi:MAG: hypothetical protein ABWY54_00240 [Glaciihabitans sp.]